MFPTLVTEAHAFFSFFGKSAMFTSVRFFTRNDKAKKSLPKKSDLEYMNFMIFFSRDS